MKNLRIVSLIVLVLVFFPFSLLAEYFNPRSKTLGNFTEVERIYLIAKIKGQYRYITIKGIVHNPKNKDISQKEKDDVISFTERIGEFLSSGDIYLYEWQKLRYYDRYQYEEIGQIIVFKDHKKMKPIALIEVYKYKKKKWVRQGVKNDLGQIRKRLDNAINDVYQ